jgi:hypothetical protein
MGFSSLIKQFVQKGIESGAITPDPATTAIPNPTPSVAAKEQAPASNVGDLYKRLTAADIEEEKKKKGMKKGGVVKSSASKRADGVATKGKTRGKMI